MSGPAHSCTAAMPERRGVERGHAGAAALRGGQQSRAAARTRWCASAVSGRCGSNPVAADSPGASRRSAVDAAAECTSTRAR